MTIDASQTVFRAKGIPLAWDEKTFLDFLIRELTPKRPASKWSRQKGPRPPTPTVHSFAAGPGGSAHATLTFETTPEILSEDRIRGRPWRALLPSYIATGEYLTLDVDFVGLTALSTPLNECHKVDIVAISGLGGHAFGSFKERGGGFMWLRDGLPAKLRDERQVPMIPMARIMTFGYKSPVAHSPSFQNLYDLALSFRNALQLLAAQKDRTRPIVFIAHSLGGLVVKKAFIMLQNSKDAIDRCLWNHVRGLAFFGVPNHGMNIESLLAMVGNGPNLGFIKSIDYTNPDNLQKELGDFTRISQNLDMVCFYETSTSPTAQEASKGKWTMTGPSVELVSKNSAIHCLPEGKNGHEYICPIPKTHSDMVKFVPGDYEYEMVLEKLRTLTQNALKAAAIAAPGLVMSSEPATPQPAVINQGLAIFMREEKTGILGKSQSVDRLATDEPIEKLHRVSGLEEEHMPEQCDETTSNRQYIPGVNDIADNPKQEGSEKHLEDGHNSGNEEAPGTMESARDCQLEEVVEEAEPIHDSERGGVLATVDSAYDGKQEEALQVVGETTLTKRTNVDNDSATMADSATEEELDQKEEYQDREPSETPHMTSGYAGLGGTKTKTATLPKQGLLESPEQDMSDIIQRSTENMATTDLPSRVQKLQSTLFAVPFPRNEGFVPRKSAMAHVENCINKAGTGGLCVLRSVAGAGKTQVALEFAYCRHESDPDLSILWIDATSKESMRQSYARIATEWQLPGHDDPDADHVQLVLPVLRNEEKGRWLMIVDNCGFKRLVLDKSVLEGYEWCFPECNHGSRLFLTRYPPTAKSLCFERPQDCWLEMGVLAIEECSSLLNSQLNGTGLTADPNELENLRVFTDGIALAIAQTGAFIRDTGCDLSTCMRSLEKGEEAALDVLKHEFEPHGRGSNTSRTMIQVLIELYQEMRDTCRPVAECWRTMAHYHVKDIPSDLLFDAVGVWPGRQESQSESVFKRSLQKLKRHRICFSCADENDPYPSNAEYLRMPPLVHLVTREYIVPPGDMAMYHAYRATKALVERFELYSETWPQFVALSRLNPKVQPESYFKKASKEVPDKRRNLAYHGSAVVLVSIRSQDICHDKRFRIPLDNIMENKYKIFREMAYSSFYHGEYIMHEGGDGTNKMKAAIHYLAEAHDMAQGFFDTSSNSAEPNIMTECLAEMYRVLRVLEPQKGETSGLELISWAETALGPSHISTIYAMECFVAGIPTKDSGGLWKKQEWLAKCVERYPFREKRDMESGRILYHHGLIWEGLEKPDEAIPLFMSILDMISDMAGDADEAKAAYEISGAVSSRLALCRIADHHGPRYQDRIYTYLFKLNEEYLGSEHIDTLRWKMHAAQAWYETGWRADAMATMEQVFPLIQQLYGGDQLFGKAEAMFNLYQSRSKKWKRLSFFNAGNDKRSRSDSGRRDAGGDKEAAAVMNSNSASGRDSRSLLSVVSGSSSLSSLNNAKFSGGARRISTPGSSSSSSSSMHTSAQFSDVSSSILPRPRSVGTSKFSDASSVFPTPGSMHTANSSETSSVSTPGSVDTAKLGA